MGFSLQWPLLLLSTGERASVVAAHGPSCPTACGIFLDQELNLCPLCRQVDSQSLDHQGRPNGDFDKSAIYRGESESCSVVSNSLQPHGLHSPWNSPGQNTGAGNRSLLQGIFPTQGSNLGLPHCRWILYQLSHQGSPYQMTTPIGSFPGGATGQEPACQCRRHETWI